MAEKMSEDVFVSFSVLVGHLGAIFREGLVSVDGRPTEHSWFATAPLLEKAIANLWKVRLPQMTRPKDCSACEQIETLIETLLDKGSRPMRMMRSGGYDGNKVVLRITQVAQAGCDRFPTEITGIRMRAKPGFKIGYWVYELTSDDLVAKANLGRGANRELQAAVLEAAVEQTRNGNLSPQAVPFLE